MRFSMTELFSDLPMIRVVDVGASPVDGAPIYEPLIKTGKARVVGFEPNPEECAKLSASENAKFLPIALGDGNNATLHLCQAPGMTSLLEPDMEILRRFHGFEIWAQVLRRQTISTRRLDDVDEVDGADFLKLDVQGSELAVLRGGARKVRESLVVQVEAQFVPFYKQQPLFAEIDQELRSAGFYLHTFLPIHKRSFKPVRVNNNDYDGLNQVLWTDAVYVRKFTEFAGLDSLSLLKIAFIAHELYESFDLAADALGHADRRDGTRRQTDYLKRLASL